MLCYKLHLHHRRSVLPAYVGYHIAPVIALAFTNFYATEKLSLSISFISRDADNFAVISPVPVTNCIIIFKLQETTRKPECGIADTVGNQSATEADGIFCLIIFHARHIHGLTAVKTAYLDIFFLRYRQSRAGQYKLLEQIGNLAVHLGVLLVTARRHETATTPQQVHSLVPYQTGIVYLLVATREKQTREASDTFGVLYAQNSRRAITAERRDIAPGNILRNRPRHVITHKHVPIVLARLLFQEVDYPAKPWHKVLLTHTAEIPMLKVISFIFDIKRNTTLPGHITKQIHNKLVETRSKNICLAIELHLHAGIGIVAANLDQTIRRKTEIYRLIVHIRHNFHTRLTSHLFKRKKQIDKFRSVTTRFSRNSYTHFSDLNIRSGA